MVQFKILSGKSAGTELVTRRFPVRIGRAADSSLRLEDAGVWEQHVEVSLQHSEGFTLSAKPNALVTLNGNAVERTLLRNGDLIELGAVKIRFWLSPSRQRGLRLREWLIWFGVGAISLTQVWLVYLLLR